MESGNFPHDNFFSTNNISDINDKYQVCPLLKHYNAFVNVQNRDHEKQISSKILTLPATRHNILYSPGTRAHFESKHILQAMILSRDDNF